MIDLMYNIIYIQKISGSMDIYIYIYIICRYLVHLVREIYDISTTTLHAMELGSPRPALVSEKLL